jgi:chromosome segregation ATPase
MALFGDREGENRRRADGEDAEAGAQMDLTAAATRRKQELSTQMVGASRELDDLRRKQDELERRKGALERLAQRQETYEQGRRDMLERLGRGIVLLEKEAGDAARMVEVIEETTQRFKHTLQELKDIDETKWSDSEYENELNRALAMVENSKRVYRGAEARIKALTWDPDKVSAVSNLASEGLGAGAGRAGFNYWLKAGLAFGIPLIVTGVVLFLLHWVLGRV